MPAIGGVDISTLDLLSPFNNATQHRHEARDAMHSDHQGLPTDGAARHVGQHRLGDRGGYHAKLPTWETSQSAWSETTTIASEWESEPPPWLIPEWLVLVVIAWAIFSVLGQTAWQSRLARAGIIVGNFSFAWKGTSFNRFLVRLALFYPAIQRTWFGLGTAVGAGTLVFAPLLLVYVLWTTTMRWFHAAAAAETSTEDLSETGGGHVQLVPIVPGLTVPMSHAMYLFSTLLVNGVLHEMGHALAALGENVRILSCGGFVSMGYPGAFVELDSHQLRKRSAPAQFKIFCAGIFHNLALFGLGVAAQHALPTLLSPWFEYRAGRAAIAAVHPLSALAASLQPRDVITSVDGTCKVTSAVSFERCIERARIDFELGITGFCVAPHEFAPTTSLSQCCSTRAPSGDNGSTLCFCSGKCNGGEDDGYACLGVRKVFAASDGRCLSSVECRTGDLCIRHVGETNSTRLLRLDIEDRDASVLFLGHPLELIRDIHLTDFATSRKGKSAFAAWLWPPDVEQFLQYFISLSAALGVLNMVPVFGFDGQYALTAAVELTELTMTQKVFTVTVICFVCTGLLVANIAVVLVGLL